MFQRAIFLGGLFVVAVVSTGAAVWQSLETNLREEQLSDASRLLETSRDEARAFKDKAQIADRRIKVLEASLAQSAALVSAQPADASAATDATDAKLRAELAAAKQQLGAAETAIREAEDRLSEEISEHAELKAKAQELMDEVAAGGRAVAATESNATSANGDTAASGATGSLPEAASTAADAAPPVAENQATSPKPKPVKRVQAKRPSKPIVRAVKPLGTPFEPML